MPRKCIQTAVSCARPPAGAKAAASGPTYEHGHGAGAAGGTGRPRRVQRIVCRDHDRQAAVPGAALHPVHSIEDRCRRPQTCVHAVHALRGRDTRTHACSCCRVFSVRFTPCGDKLCAHMHAGSHCRVCGTAEKQQQHYAHACMHACKKQQQQQQRRRRWRRDAHACLLLQQQRRKWELPPVMLRHRWYLNAGVAGEQRQQAALD